MFAVIIDNFNNFRYNRKKAVLLTSTKLYNKKSPRARSLNYAGNEYENEYVFFVLSRNDENDILAKYAFFKRLRTYNDMMETVVESWYNKPPPRAPRG